MALVRRLLPEDPRAFKEARLSRVSARAVDVSERLTDLALACTSPSSLEGPGDCPASNRVLEFDHALEVDVAGTFASFLAEGGKTVVETVENSLKICLRIDNLELCVALAVESEYPAAVLLASVVGVGDVLPVLDLGRFVCRRSGRGCKSDDRDVLEVVRNIVLLELDVGLVGVGICIAVALEVVRVTGVRVGSLSLVVDEPGHELLLGPDSDPFPGHAPQTCVGRTATQVKLD